MTPAQRKGLVVGQSYRVADNYHGTDYAGKTVKFVEDDGTCNPWFSEHGERRAINVEYINHPAPVAVTEPLSYKIDVGVDATTIVVNKSLSTSQVKAILDLIGG